MNKTKERTGQTEWEKKAVDDRRHSVGLLANANCALNTWVWMQACWIWARICSSYELFRASFLWWPHLQSKIAAIWINGILNSHIGIHNSLRDNRHPLKGLTNSLFWFCYWQENKTSVIMTLDAVSGLPKLLTIFCWWLLLISLFW